MESHNIFHKKTPHFLAYAFIYTIFLFNMMERTPHVWWNSLLSYISTAVTEGSACARYSTFSHLTQQALLHMAEHLQQPDKTPQRSYRPTSPLVTVQQYISSPTMFGQMLYSDCISCGLYLSFPNTAEYLYLNKIK